MRLLHVTATYPPFLGGAGTYIQAMSERFCMDGHDVQLVTTDAAEVEYFWNPRKDHLSIGHDVLNGVDISRCAVTHLPLAPWSFYLLRRLATVLGRMPGSVPILRRLAPWMPGVPAIEATLESLPGPFDVVHGINVALEWPLLAAWRYARRYQIPFVVTPFVHVGEHKKKDVLINYVMPHQLEAL